MANATAWYDDTDDNVFEDFCNMPAAMIVIVSVVVVTNMVAITLCIYTFISQYSRIKRAYYLLAGIIFEILASIARIVNNLDPLGCERLIPTSVSDVFLVWGVAFTIIDCLLLSIYLHETMSMKDLKVNAWLAKGQYAFYVVCCLLFAICIVIPLTKLSPAYPNIFTICIVCLAIISLGVGVFFLVTSCQIVTTLKDMKSMKGQDIQKLSVRLFVNSGLFLVWVVILFIAALATFAKYPVAHTVLSMVFKCSLASIAIINMISLLQAGNKSSSSGGTKKTKSRTKTSSNSKKNEEEIDDKVGSVSEEESKKIEEESEGEGDS